MVEVPSQAHIKVSGNFFYYYYYTPGEFSTSHSSFLFACMTELTMSFLTEPRLYMSYTFNRALRGGIMSVRPHPVCLTAAYKVEHELRGDLNRSMLDRQACISR